MSAPVLNNLFDAFPVPLKLDANDRFMFGDAAPVAVGRNQPALYRHLPTFLRVASAANRYERDDASVAMS